MFANTRQLEFNRFRVLKLNENLVETKITRMKMTEIADGIKEKCVFLVGGKHWKIETSHTFWPQACAT